MEKYEDRYRARPETYDALVDVWTRVAGVRGAFTSWLTFGKAAIAEKQQREQFPERVERAEGFMWLGGYESGPKEDGVGRRWWKIGSQEP